MTEPTTHTATFPPAGDRLVLGWTAVYDEDPRPQVFLELSDVDLEPGDELILAGVTDPPTALATLGATRGGWQTRPNLAAGGFARSLVLDLPLDVVELTLEFAAPCRVQVELLALGRRESIGDFTRRVAESQGLDLADVGTPGTSIDLGAVPVADGSMTFTDRHTV